MRTPETTANKERMRFLNKTLDRSTDQIARLTKANAELLEALKAVRDMGIDDRSEAWAQVDTAIADAEGRS